MKKQWATEDVALLRQLSVTHSDEEIAVKLGRTKRAVEFKRQALGLKKKNGTIRRELAKEHRWDYVAGREVGDL